MSHTLDLPLAGAPPRRRAGRRSAPRRRAASSRRLIARSAPSPRAGATPGPRTGARRGRSELAPVQRRAAGVCERCAAASDFVTRAAW